MSNPPTVIEINLSRATRELKVSFDDGAQFTYSCEYLRVFSPAAEVKAARAKGDFVHVNEAVNIERISPIGGYAVQLAFSDGHDTGIYSWQTLYELGEQFLDNWRRYLQWKKTAVQHQATEDRKVEILYFATLAQIADQESETMVLPAGVHTVKDLLSLLSERGELWAQQLCTDTVKVTVNRQFAALHQGIDDGDEIAFTP